MSKFCEICEKPFIPDAAGNGCEGEHLRDGDDYKCGVRVQPTPSSPGQDEMFTTGHYGQAVNK